MNPKRLILAIIVVFAAMWATDFLIHGVWLQSTYKETASLWRTEADMTAHMVWLFLGQLLAAATFVVIWSKGFPAVTSMGGSCLYGITMALFAQANTLITYAVQPMPEILMLKWFIAGVVQGLVLGMIVFLVGKPKATVASSAA